MRKTKETRKKQKGVTLIALVVTVIVLLILAGITIAALTGNNGIITQATQAKDSNNIAGLKEKVEVEALKSIDKRGNFNKGTFKTGVEKNIKGSSVTENGNWIIVKADGYKVKIDGTTGDIIGEPSKIVLVKPGVTVSETDKDNYSDGTSTATIPAGFEVDETENTISEGLVVHGPDKANGDKGSEFVWVPVPDINNMAQCSTAGGNCNLQLDGETLKCTTHDSTDIVGKIYSTAAENNSIDDTANTSYNINSGLREPAIVSNCDNDTNNNNNLFTIEKLKEDYKNMATSVAKYGGFYVGRYELSLTDATDSLVGTSGTAQSKQGVIPSSSKDSGTLTWYGLYSKQDKTYEGTNNSVESSMIWGSQYDRILNWVKEGNDEEEKNKLTQTEIGNINTTILYTTGNSRWLKDNIKNIRDLNGNLREWTLEALGTERRTIRGGSCINRLSLSCRVWANPPTVANNVYGSRFTLYIK